MEFWAFLVMSGTAKNKTNQRKQTNKQTKPHRNRPPKNHNPTKQQVLSVNSKKARSQRKDFVQADPVAKWSRQIMSDPI